jgi:hypothetical protein
MEKETGYYGCKLPPGSCICPQEFRETCKYGHWVREREPGNCEAPNGGGRTTADCPGEECRRSGECQVA